MEEKAELIDVSKCMACRACQVACKQWNKLPATTTQNKGTYENPAKLNGSTYTRVIFKEQVIDGKLKWLFRKEQCLHCTTAACVNICPVKARSKNEFGFTEIDKEKCIGCGVCSAACPFKVPGFEEETRKATGCKFCLDRIQSDREPACAKTCPTGAIKFGTRAEMLDLAHKIMNDSKTTKYLYGEKEFGGTHMLYILPEEPATYGLPKDTQILSNIEAYAMLQEFLKTSPRREEILAIATRKYFGRVEV